MTSLFVLLFFFFGFSYGAENRNSDAEKRLYRDLMANCTRGRPKINWRETIHVNIGMQLFQITNLDAVNQILTILAEIPMDWTDDYLRWDPEDYDGITNAVIPADDVWLPDLGLGNGAYRFRAHEWRQIFPVWVQADGVTNMGIRTSFQTTCSLKMTYFPFDSQSCTVLISTIVSPASQVNLTKRYDEINTRFFQVNEEWSISSTEIHNVIRQPIPGLDFSDVEFIINMARKPMFYVVNIVLPSTMLSFLTLLMFLLPCESGEKVSLGITVLLSYVVFMLMVADNVPKNSETIPILQIYLFVVTVLNALAVAVTVVVIRIFHVGHPVTSVPPNLRRFLYVVSAGCCQKSKSAVKENSNSSNNTRLFSVRQATVAFDDDLKKPEYDPTGDNAESEAGVTMRHKRSDELTDDEKKQEWQMVARLVDKICLFLFFAVILISTVISFTPHWCA